jgi:hypothetical protein
MDSPFFSQVLTQRDNSCLEGVVETLFLRIVHDMTAHRSDENNAAPGASLYHSIPDGLI